MVKGVPWEAVQDRVQVLQGALSPIPSTDRRCCLSAACGRSPAAREAFTWLVDAGCVPAACQMLEVTKAASAGERSQCRRAAE